MEREIKFRIWDGKQEYMITKPHLTIEHGIAKTNYRLEVMMQFTGIKDKNGKEIYEGDIIRFEDEKYTHKVEFIAPEFVRHCIQNDLRNQILPFKSFHKYEVIGNIFENPELLHS